MASIDGSAGTNRSADTSAHTNAHDNTNNTSDASSPDRAPSDVAVADKPTTEAPPNTKERPVKHGDTVRSIAEEENITVQHLYELNPDIDPANHDVPMERMQAHWDPEYLYDKPTLNVPEVILAEADGGAITTPQKLNELPDASVVLAEGKPSLSPTSRSNELGIDQAVVDAASEQPDWSSLPVNELVARAESDIRTAITGPKPLTGWSLVDEVSSGFDDIKVGYAMGSVAANIEARLDSYPAADRDFAAQYAEALRLRGDSLSFGAARDASPNATVFAYKGQCYESANALAAAVTHERYDPTVTRVSEWTPEMQEQSQIAAMDREIWNRGAGIGFSWAETGYMIARGNGADASELSRAYAFGQLADIGLGIGSALAPVIGARSNSLNGSPRSNDRATDPTLTPAAALKKPILPALMDSAASAASKMTIKIQHVLTGEINKSGKAVGFHSRPDGINPPTAKMTSLTEAADVNGVYKGNVAIYDSSKGVFVPKKAPSSFFPDNLSPKQIETAVRNAYADALRTGNVNGPSWTGKSGLGFDIVGFVDGATITSAYPIHVK